jgi:thiosulfate/3-mercaptopyruvate sulfurtransferase
MIADEADVEAGLRTDVPLIDTRPSDQFLGINRSRSVKGKGTLPGARNLPLTWLTEDDGGRFRSESELSRLAAFAGVPPRGRQIVFCNTGHTASLGWFVLHEIPC